MNLTEDAAIAAVGLPRDNSLTYDLVGYSSILYAGSA